MRRGAKPAKAKVEAKRPVARKSRKRQSARVGHLEKRLAEALKREAQALEQQTATSEILRVIAGSSTDPQPVFDAILKRAATLCEAQLAHLWLYEGGEQFRLGAGYGSRPDHLQWLQQGLHRFGRPFFRESGPWRVGQVLDVRDTEPYRRGEPFWIRTADHEGMRTLLGVPLVKDGRLVGSIAVYRREVQPFTDQQTALVQTFADQAVIAIENVRLFNETKEALEQQTATSEILRVISQSQTDVQPVFDTIAANARRLCNASSSAVFTFDGELIHLAAQEHMSPQGAALVRGTFPMPPGRGSTAARAIMTRSIAQITEAREDPEYVLRDATEIVGFRSVLAVPMLRGGHPIGAVSVGKTVTGPFPDKQIALLQSFADQAVIAIENVRLFTELAASNREIAEKSHQLEVASQHKSEFLANMSHELRTPLNAVIGFSEVLLQRMFGELNDKQDEYLKDIYASGQHLLSLINDILDLSKIEAGRMELELTDFDFPAALDSALTLIRERAGRRGIALHLSVDERLGQLRADERKIRQVVLNLLSNAIKFTPEGGRIEVVAVPRDEFVEVSVSDTGIGIAPEDQEAVFEEFRQVGTAAKKVEGTGLGLALSRKFIELHDGRIWLESRVGIGSTFTFSIPVQRADQVIE